jgi:hypothetical protein
LLFARYFRDVIANVACWLNGRAHSGFPNWTTTTDDDPMQLFKADHSLSATLDWLREAGKLLAEIEWLVWSYLPHHLSKH